MRASSCLRFSGKAFQRWWHFFDLGRQGLSSERAFQEKQDKGGAFVLCSYRPQQILWVWIISSDTSSVASIFELLVHVALHTCTTKLPCPTGRDEVSVMSQWGYIYQHAPSTLLSVWQFPITRTLATQEDTGSLCNPSCWFRGLSQTEGCRGGAPFWLWLWGADGSPSASPLWGVGIPNFLCCRDGDGNRLEGNFSCWDSLVYEETVGRWLPA